MEGWKSFREFADWSQATGFFDGEKRLLQLRRQDANGNYSPDNCRWMQADEANQLNKPPIKKASNMNEIETMLQARIQTAAETIHRAQTEISVCRDVLALLTSEKTALPSPEPAPVQVPMKRKKRARRRVQDQDILMLFKLDEHMTIMDAVRASDYDYGTIKTRLNRFLSDGLLEGNSFKGYKRRVAA